METPGSDTATFPKENHKRMDHFRKVQESEAEQKCFCFYEKIRGRTKTADYE